MINHILAIGAVAAFPLLLLFANVIEPRRFFIYYVLLLFPIMDLAITPVEWGRLRVFDLICYLYLVMHFTDYLTINKTYKFYTSLFVIFIILLVLGCLNSLYVRDSLISLSAIFPVFIFSKAILKELTIDRDFQEEVVNAMKLVALFSVAFVVMQMIFGLGFTFYPVLNRNTSVEEGVIRYPSFFHDPQMYGQYLVLVGHLLFISFTKKTLPVTIGSETNNPTSSFIQNTIVKNPTLKNYFYFLIIIFGLLQTGGRSALLALLTGIVFLFFVFDRQYKLVISGIFAAAVIGFLIFSSSLKVFNRAEHAADDYNFRVALWEEAQEIFVKHPVLGIGVSNFKQYNMSYSRNYTVNEENEVIFFGYGQPESGYWMILTETGATGFIVIFLFILRPIYTAIRSYLKGNSNIIVFIMTAGILSWLVTFIAAYSLHDRRIVIVLISLLCMLIQESNKSDIKYEVLTHEKLSL